MEYLQQIKDKKMMSPKNGKKSRIGSTDFTSGFLSSCILHDSTDNNKNNSNNGRGAGDKNIDGNTNGSSSNR